MSTLQIHVDDDIQVRLAARAAEHGFRNVEEYVNSLIIADVGDGQFDDDLEELLLRRLDGGPGIVVTTELIAKFKQDVASRMRPSETSR